MLHDLFAVPFEDIAPIVDRSPAAARQLASRARRRVQGATRPTPATARRQQEIVEAFLAASRRGDFETLGLPARSRRRPSRRSGRGEIRHRRTATEAHPSWRPKCVAAGPSPPLLSGRAAAAQLALIEGTPGAVWAPGGRPRAIFAFRIVGDTVTEIEIVTDPAVVKALQVQLLT